MANAAEDKSKAGVRVTETFDSVSPALGDQVAKLVDSLGLGDNVFLLIKNTPTAEDPHPQRVLVMGTPVQIGIFRGALETYRRAVQDGNSVAEIATTMGHYRERFLPKKPV